MYTWLNIVICYSNPNFRDFSGLFLGPQIKFGLGPGSSPKSWPVYNSVLHVKNLNVEITDQLRNTYVLYYIRTLTFI